MDPQIVDLGGSVLVLGILWRVAMSIKGLNRRLDKVEKGQERMGDNILRIVGGLGEVKGELKRIAPIERVGTPGS